MSYRIIALDLDGTLLTPDKTILPASIEALHKAQQAGIKILIVTGRHHVAIHPFYQALALDTPAICCNGTYSYDYQAKTVLESDPLPLGQSLQCLRCLTKRASTACCISIMQCFTKPRWAMLPAPLIGHSPCRRRSARRFAGRQSGRRGTRCAIHLEICPRSLRYRRVTAVRLPVEADMGLACEWSWHDQVDIAKAGNSRASAWRSGWRLTASR